MDSLEKKVYEYIKEKQWVCVADIHHFIGDASVITSLELLEDVGYIESDNQDYATYYAVTDKEVENG